MHICRFYLFTLILIIGLDIKAQDIQLTFHHLTEEKGLTNGDQYKLFKDSRDLIWIGTDDGLLRFDGHQIKKYQHEPMIPTSLSEHSITSQCFEDEYGDLWFTSEGAVNCYRRDSDDFVSYQHSNNIKTYHGLYLDDNGQFWLQIGIGKEGALYSFDMRTGVFTQSIPLEGKQCEVVKNQEGVLDQLLSTALPNKPGLIWTNIKTGEKKVVEFIFTRTGRKRKFSSPTKKAFVDSDNIAWIGVYNGLGKYHLGSDEGFIETERSKSVDADIGWVSDIIEYDDTRLFIASNSGLLIFNKHTHTFEQQFRFDSDEPFSLALKDINNLYLDSEKNIWLSSSQQEIAFAHLPKNKFSKISATLGSFISSIAEDHDGNIWCSTLDAGTFVFNQNKELLFQTSTLKNPTKKNGFSELTPLYFFIKNNKKQWWGNLENTYLLWNPLSKEFEFDLTYFLGVSSITSQQINYNYELSNGKNLIAKGSNIYELLLSKEKVEISPWYDLEYLQFQTVNIIFEDRNKYVYIGDKQGRLVILKKQNDQLIKIADIHDLGICYAFQEDLKRNTIWLTSSKGLGQIDPRSFEYRLLEPTKDQFPNEPIYSVVVDQLGQLWLPGNNGLIRYHPETKAFQRFGIADGLCSPVFNKNTCIKVSGTGEIWLGSKNGVNVFKPEAIQLLDLKPDVQFSQFLVNDEQYEIEGNLNEKKELTFDYNQNTLSFQFVALDYSDPKSNQFVCQMVGYDKAPVDNGTRNFIRYGNLPAGNYTFKVWGTNSDGIKSEKPKTISINIIPPFYQTWWFYLICTILISSIIYGIFQYRLKQALKVERLRVKISSDLHDDVGGLLSGLAMQTEVLELTATKEIKPKLQRIAELSRSAMSRMRDTVWAIDARKDKLENLLDRMREHAEETLTPRSIHCDIEHFNIDLGANIPTDIRQNLYLIYKEAITNVAKHSNGDTVFVAMKRSKGQFEMCIRDNGKVEEKNYKPSGMGQSNMKMRAHRIGASLQTIKENGYEINLKMKTFT